MDEQTRIDDRPQRITPPEATSEPLRLFEPAPEQIPGQLAIPAPDEPEKSK